MTNVSHEVINETEMSHIGRNKNVSRGMFAEVTSVTGVGPGVAITGRETSFNNQFPVSNEPD